MAKEKKEATPSQEGKKKGKGKLFFIVIILLILIGAGIGVKMFLLSGKKRTVYKNAKTTQQAAEESSAPPPSEATYAPVNISNLTPVTIGPLIVNLADVGGDRYLKIKLVLLEVPSAARKGKMEGEKEGISIQDAIIRDTIITVLSSKTSDDLLSVSGKEELKNELITAINQALHRNLVRKIYFLDFIIQ